MKSFAKGLFVIFFVAMSAVAVPAAFAQTDGKKPGHENPDPGKPEPVDICTNIAEGCVTYTAYRTIVIDGVTTFKTPLNWTLPQVDDEIRIKYWVNPDGVKVACDMEIIGTCL